MLPRLLLIAAVLTGLYFLVRWWRRSGWGVWNSRLAIAAGITLLLLLILRSSAEIVVPLLAVLAPFLLRWLSARRMPSPAATPAASGCSTVITRFLSMKLDHTTGAMSGLVLEGCFIQQALCDLTLQELLDLWRECQIDPQSVAVLETYLDRCADSNWRDLVGGTDNFNSAASSTVMDRSEAYQVLGLQPNASCEEIQAAYRRLIQRVHPDHGGSAYLAARLNLAREVLLN
ncbi:MAG: DnaJ domain-containing protein [Candidatus Competibacteraceae bacterium]|uniref:Heat shock protein DnaJ n=1 Tax=Candidatus Contendobacter odensis Run_B_J11 TaxID=1400861 RepID=A0A7U7J2E6_9GAMM|nr:DnaJ domain-containing protein [Candidatus Contendobacter odensis]MBK8535272.1 DnaJ domain-containing protein [Candidatus Competibacteraceae bacterium]MBK8752848.1 DnaJ domain-containing protein [Candidatus Competibacteraceae bacterium]CDH43263.1 putative Heat shock protein DnaJ [Candidatus Contendobacter odensis Run_B_J11]